MKKYIFLLFLITIGCSNNKVVYNHGLLAIEAKSDKIEISKTNKNDVLKIFGKPSTISLFDDNLWFYIQRVKKNQSIIKLGNTKITSNKVLEIKFNSYGLVENKKLYLIEDMNELKKVKKVTTKEFETTSKLGKLLKSLEQKINSPKTNKKK
tara:strand:+ start:657 stop:1112 length:456 start_codon:yes stop_codon:yes gene_type:complete